MAMFGEDKGKSAAKINLKEMTAFFLALLFVVGLFSFVGYKYNSKVDTVVDGLLDQNGISVLAISKAEKKAEKLEIEIKDAQYNLQRVSDLLSNEKSKLKRKKEAAISEVAALEEELELIDINSKRVSGLLDKEREKLETQKAEAIAEIAEKEAELEAENARVDKLYKEEMIRLEEKKQKAIDLVAAKSGEVEALEKGDTALNKKESEKSEEYRLDEDETREIDLSSTSAAKKKEELKGKDELNLSSKEQNIATNDIADLTIKELEPKSEIPTKANTNEQVSMETTKQAESSFVGLFKAFGILFLSALGLLIVGYAVASLSRFD